MGVEVATHVDSSSACFVDDRRSTTRTACGVPVDMGRRSGVVGAPDSPVTTSARSALRRCRPGRRLVVRREDPVGRQRRGRLTGEDGGRTSSRTAFTPADRRSRCWSSSRTSVQVNSSCWPARLPARPSTPSDSRCATTRAQTSSTPVSSRPEQVSTGGTQPLRAAVHQAQRAGQLLGRGPRLVGPVAVGLVDRDHVRDLEDALLDPLQLVAGAGQGQEQERVDHARHGDLGLADADGLDQHHVVARRLEHDHRLGRRPGHSPERAGCGRGADVGVRVGGQPRHPGLVAEHRAAGAHRRRVDREHARPSARRRSAAGRASR